MPFFIIDVVEFQFSGALAECSGNIKCLRINGWEQLQQKEKLCIFTLKEIQFYSKNVWPRMINPSRVLEILSLLLYIFTRDWVLCTTFACQNIHFGRMVNTFIKIHPHFVHYRAIKLKYNYVQSNSIMLNSICPVHFITPLSLATLDQICKVQLKLSCRLVWAYIAAKHTFILMILQLLQMQSSNKDPN